MKIEISGSVNSPQTVTLGGERFVILPEREYARLRATAEGQEPALPARDKHGHYPAAEALGSRSPARSVVHVANAV